MVTHRNILVLKIQNYSVLPESQNLNGNIFFELFLGDFDKKMTSTGYKGGDKQTERDSAISR